jgi:hypothetical protein
MRREPLGRGAFQLTLKSYVRFYPNKPAMMVADGRLDSRVMTMRIRKPLRLANVLEVERPEAPSEAMLWADQAAYLVAVETLCGFTFGDGSGPMVMSYNYRAGVNNFDEAAAFIADKTLEIMNEARKTPQQTERFCLVAKLKKGAIEALAAKAGGIKP